MRNGKSSAQSGNRWRVVSAPRQRAVWAYLAPNDQLRWLPASGGGSWKATGNRAGLVLDQRALERPLPAGWYELRGRLDTLDIADGNIVLPSVYVRHVDHSAMTDFELMLPEPDVSGRIATLLVFFDDVESLEFYPGICPARFRMRDFSLHRVSRLRALRAMLGGPGGARRIGLARRAVAWGRNAMSRSVKRATEDLYADYRQRMRPRGVSEYAAWIRKYDSLDRTALDAFKQCAQALGERGPLISVLLAVYDTPEPALRRCLDSVLAQAWERWEVCAVDSVGPASRVLAEYAVRDPRIRVVRPAHEGHGESDAALAMARGAFIVPLDPGGELRPHALLRVAEAAAADPELAMVYSDEDSIDASDRCFDPVFKPDWNPDLLRSRNYVGHLVAIRTALMRENGGFRTGFGDSRDYDLILRCSENAAPRQIRHIPEILYHERVEADGAVDEVHDREGGDSDVRAVADHLRRISSAASIETGNLPHGLHRVRWPLPRPVPKISLIVPTRDRIELLRQCVESIFEKSTYPDFELLVVDNQSRDRAALNYLRELAARGRVRVLRYDAPFNYSAINNRAARQCTGQLLGLVNNDIEVISPDWLEEMASLAMRPDTGAVGALLYYPDDTIQHAGMVLGIHGVAGHVYAGMPRGYPGYGARGRVVQNLSVVTGACLLVRREVFDAVGGLDEQLPVEFNDVDFCLRLRQQGYRNVWTPFAELYHHESASRDTGDVSATSARREGVAFMLDRWGDCLRDDPAYNTNLSLQGRNFELAFPPRGRSSDPAG